MKSRWDTLNRLNRLLVVLSCLMVIFAVYFAFNKIENSSVNNQGLYFNEKIDRNIFFTKSAGTYLLIRERSAEIFCEIKGYDFVNKFTIGLNGDFSCTKGFTGKERTFLNGTTYMDMSYTSHSFPLKCLETVYLKDVECKSKLEGEI